MLEAATETNSQNKANNPDMSTKLVKPLEKKRIRNRKSSRRFRFLRGNRTFRRAAKENTYFSEQVQTKNIDGKSLKHACMPRGN